MGIQANAPWALLLLLPWIIYIWWMTSRTLRLKGARKIYSIATRALITLLLIAIAAQLKPYTAVEQRNVIFVADRSASMHNDERIGSWIAQAWESKQQQDRGGILSAGLNAAVERVLTDQPLDNSESYTFRASVNNQYTDLSQGLQLAAALLQKEGGGRIVLLSDGAQNSGDALRQARMLGEAGISVDVVQIASVLKQDAAIETLSVPGSLKQGETFTFEITVNSTTVGTGQLRLFADNRELSVSEVQLETGENRFALQSIALDPGFHRFRAELYMEGDEQQANNAAYAFSRVSGPPAVLIVEGAPGSSSNIEAALTASVIRHQTIMPEQLSVELVEYAAYDSIILNNVPATRIAEKPMEWLAKAVGDYGVGLVMLGGEDSFGLGGYFKTPVERALPVYMDLQGKKQIPSLGLVLVIDRSGSMDGGKLELAKEAAMRTIELLRDEDTVGVVAFDSSPWWVVEPTKLSDREAVLEQIQGVQPNGGTEIYSALREGYNGLEKLDAQRKHMILLTDGQSATNLNYRTITDAMNERNMTLSTVAVGDGADQRLLQQLASDAKGRYYFTKDQSTLPAIFSRETVMMSRTYIVEQLFTPSIGHAGDWSALWQQGIPSIHAYIATTPKETAEIALWSPSDDPLLARWAYGSGRTVAWTSDLMGKWSSEWVSWPALPKVFVEWVKWTFPQFNSSPYTTTAGMDGNEAKLRIRAEGGEAATGSGLAAVIQDQTGGSEQRRLMPIAPGEYEAGLEIAEPGAYLVQIGQLGEDSTIQNGTTAGFVIPYSPEYKISNTDGPLLLEQLASLSDGRILDVTNPGEVFEFDPVKSHDAYDWTRVLLIAILLLWLLDIAIRRISIPWHRLQAVFSNYSEKRRSAAPKTMEGSAASALTRLKERTAETKRFYDSEGSNSKISLQQTENIATDNKSSAYTRKIEEERKLSQQNHAQPQNAASPKQTESGKTSEGAEESAQEGTINRLLAAKNRSKR